MAPFNRQKSASIWFFLVTFGHLVTTLDLALVATASIVPSGITGSKPYLDTLSKNQRAVFDYAIQTLNEASRETPPFVVWFLFSLASLAFLIGDSISCPQFNSVRYGVWHGVGLLARNEGNDSAVAAEIFSEAWVIAVLSSVPHPYLCSRQRLKFQYLNPADKWYGTFKDSPGEPDPGPDNPPVVSIHCCPTST